MSLVRSFTFGLTSNSRLFHCLGCYLNPNMSVSAKFPLHPPPLHHPPSITTLKPFSSHTTKFTSPNINITLEKISTKPIIIASASASQLQPLEELPPKLQHIVKLFQGVDQPKAKYEQLLFYGRNLKPLDSTYKTSENKVQGCVSQVWVRAYLDHNNNVFFEADSDSALTKGLAALLVQGLSGSPVEDILKVTPDFVVLLGLQQSLTPSRNNGFLNMLKLMQKKALQLYIQGEEPGSGHGPGPDPGHSNEDENLVSGENRDESRVTGPRAMRIKERLEKELRPVELEVIDVSHQHAGHAAVRGSGDGETHFNVNVVSEEFQGKSLVKRHRLIYDLLQDELQNGLHALSIVAKTPTEVGSS